MAWSSSDEGDDDSTVDATSGETRAWAAECMTKQMNSCKALAKGKLLKSMADFESSEA